jgi:hypothetical protein
MTEKLNATAKTEEKEKNASEKSSLKQSLPIGATIEDILRASKIVMDKGGSVRFGEISNMFGSKVSEQNLLGFALNGAVAFGILEAHSGRAPYVLSTFGKNFLTAQNEQQPKMLLPKFLGFPPYRDILIGMKNREEKNLKKQTITGMWINIAGGKIATRKLYTRTFASVGQWSGAIEDSGQVCGLKQEAEGPFSQILAGKEAEILQGNDAKKTLEATVSGEGIQKQSPQHLEQKAGPLSNDLVRCPICNKGDMVVNEKYLDKIPTKGGTLLIFERTYHCQGCSNNFTRTVKEIIPSPD